MRELTGRRIDGIEDGLFVAALDEPGSGGACHSYQISFTERQNSTPIHVCHFNFQNGPIKEAGVNGITNESLLDILIDRMEGFQSGVFSCRENQLALDAPWCARTVLLKRTRGRLARNVEGTNLP